MKCKHNFLWVILFCLNVTSYSQWPTELDSAIDFPGMHYGRYLPDGRGGAWVAGEDYFGSLYVTRVTREGTFVPDAQWLTIGGLYDGQFSSGMFMSEDSCLILAFCQYEYIQGQVNPKGYAYLQKIDLQGNKMWTEGGVLVSTEQSSQPFGALNGIPELCTDQQGGAYVSWLDYRLSAIFPAIFSQHVWSDGSVDWQTGGKCILDYIDDDWVYIYATPDSQFVTGTKFNNEHKFMYFMTNAEGDTLYQLSHLVGLQGNLIAIDEDYNYYYRDGYSDAGIFMHKFSRDGTSLWGEEGTLIIERAGVGYVRSSFVDESGGYFFSGNHDGVYFQWIDPNGVPYFDSAQYLSMNTSKSSFTQTDSNHVMFVQNEVLGNTMYVYSQRISNTGERDWPDSTIVHIQANQSEYMLGPDNVSDGNGGEIVFFQHAYLKAKQISRDGINGDITLPVLPWKPPIIPESINCSIQPNPSNSQIVINLDEIGVGDLSLEIYNLRGQLVYQQNHINSGLDKSINISLSSLGFSSGTYIVKLDNGITQIAHARFTLIK